MKKWIAAGVGAALLVIAAGVGGYFLGVSRGEARARESVMQFARGRTGGTGVWQGPSGTPQAGQGGGTRDSGPSGTMGTIASIEGDTVTLTTQDDTVEVKVSDTTLVLKTMSVGVAQLEVGEQVMVSGSRNDDGTISARSIQAVRAGQFGRSDQLQGGSQ